MVNQATCKRLLECPRWQPRDSRGGVIYSHVFTLFVFLCLQALWQLLRLLQPTLQSVSLPFHTIDQSLGRSLQSYSMVPCQCELTVFGAS